MGREEGKGEKREGRGGEGKAPSIVVGLVRRRRGVGDWCNVATLCKVHV